MDHIAKAYQSIGEFVVSFQWIESKYREIGWTILDPERKSWPPMQFRQESNKDLINKVTDLFQDLVDKHDFPNGAERAADMQEIRLQFHELRKYRNRLIHSAYIELKAGGELHGYLRINPKISVDSDTGEIIQDIEPLTEDRVKAKMADTAYAAFKLSQHHIQLIHWSPFDRYQKTPQHIRQALP